MCLMLKIYIFKIFDKVSYVQENFVKILMIMFKIKLGLNLGYYIYFINLKRSL